MFRFVIATAALLLPATAFAQAASTPPVSPYPDLSSAAKVKRAGVKDVAVIVAVEDYLLLPDVPGAVRNANDWEVFFRHSLGVKNVHMMVNEGASREDILSGTKRALVDAHPEGRVWFLFIGHGAPKEDGSDGVLVGMDAKGTASSLDARGVRRSELLDLLGTGKQKRTIALFDACFSGRSSSGALAPGVQPVVAVPKVKKADMVVFSAAKADQVAGALPRAQRPAFSYLMLGAMRGWADSPGDNGRLDGAVTAAEAEQYVARQLRAMPGRTQVPDLAGDVNFRLTVGAKEKAPDLHSAAPTVATQPTYVPKKAPKTVVEPQKADRVNALLKKGYKPKKIIGKPLTKSEIAQTTAKRQFSFLHCGFQKAEAKGNVEMKFSIRPDGSLHNASVPVKHRGSAFGDCMLRVLNEVTFRPTSATKDVRATYGVFFNSK